MAKAFSVKEFCLAHGISQSFYFKLRAAGQGPRVMQVGSRTLISDEAAADWRRRMEESTELTPAA